jgi:hypothetical protein
MIRPVLIGGPRCIDARSLSPGNPSYELLTGLSFGIDHAAAQSTGQYWLAAAEALSIPDS